MSEIPLTGGDIRSYLHEVAATHDPGGVRHTVVLVGGALLAVAGLRASTVDVDAVRLLDSELRRADAVVAAAHLSWQTSGGRGERVGVIPWVAGLENRTPNSGQVPARNIEPPSLLAMGHEKACVS